MIQDEDVKFLKETLSFWKKLNDIQKEMLKGAIVKKHFTVGEAMKSASDNCSGLFLLQSGQVRAYIVSEGGKEITLYRLFERDACIFTASCVLKNIDFDIYIEVEKETDALLIPTLIFKKLSDEVIAVQNFSNELIAARFTEVMWIMEQALFTRFDKRLAIFLIEQANIEGSLKLTITHEKIADNLGTAREVVTRMLKYFQKESLVSLHRNSIEILDRKKLEAIAS